MKTYNFWTISKCEILSRRNLIRPILLASLKSIWNNFVVRNNSPRIKNSDYAEQKAKSKLFQNVKKMQATRTSIEGNYSFWTQVEFNLAQILAYNISQRHLLTLFHVSYRWDVGGKVAQK